MAAKLPTGDVLDARPTVKEPARFGIGMIGSGNIVENAHIPAYQAAGYRIVGIASRNREHAEGVANRKSLARTFDSIEALLNDPEVDVVDIAVPPDFQPAIVEAALRAGKHVLAQKPVATNYKDSVAMVSLANEVGRTLAVNLNGRFDPSINAARQLISEGRLGTRLVASINMCIAMPWQEYYKVSRWDQLMILNMSVHHIDQFRWMFGDPVAVSAFGRTTPGPYFGENVAQYNLFYADDFLATALDDGSNWSDDFGITYRIQGTDMSLKGVIGWPHGTYSELSARRPDDDGWRDFAFSRQWFPDAFSATMGELLSSLEVGREPRTSARSALPTMAAIVAAYRSMKEQRTVTLAEVVAENGAAGG